MTERPDCYRCAHRRRIPGDCHSSCDATGAKVTGDPQGIKRGWFYWPINFDPTWLNSCDSFKEAGNA